MIKDITKDEQKAINIMRQLKSFEPERKRKNNNEEDGASLLLRLAKNKTELCFKDQDGKFYALIKVVRGNDNDNDEDSYEIVDLDCEDFELKLGVWYYEYPNKNVWRNDHYETKDELARKEWFSLSKLYTTEML